MAFVECVHEDCKQQFDISADIIFNLKNAVFNGRTGSPQWEATCPHCKRANFLSVNLEIKSISN